MQTSLVQNSTGKVTETNGLDKKLRVSRKKEFISLSL